MKKYVELDSQSQPFGSIKEVLYGDIKKYAKELDFTTRWDDQTHSDQKQLLRRLYVDKYRKLITQCMCHISLITYCHCSRTFEGTCTCPARHVPSL